MKKRYPGTTLLKRNTISPFFQVILLFLFSQSFCLSPVTASSSLTVEDEIVMNRMIKNSVQTDELKLFLKLFPASPYHRDVEQRLFRIEMKAHPKSSDAIFDPSTAKGITWNVNPTLTATDEITMSRMVSNSRSQKEINLFLKVFPSSRFSSILADRKRSLERNEEVDDQTKSFKKMEAEIVKQEVQKPPKKNKQDLPTDKPDTPKEEMTPEKKQTPSKAEKKEDPPEGDWAKFEVGIPTSLDLQETNGTAVVTDENAQGIFIGWSSEILFDIGMGGAISYFTQKLNNDEGELRHLYIETHLKGRILGHINLGVGYGSGFTTIGLGSTSDNRTVVPGEGTIKSVTIGGRWGAFGINYILSEFTGAYRWQLNSGVNSSNGKERWKGTLNMITIEYLY